MATRFVKASYQEIIDLHTESGHVTAIGIHTPTGDTPRKMFKGYFDQYKKFKYAGAKISFAPVATLPADPLSVSYKAGEPTIDPRDLANPILVHGCHGNDMGTILNKLYGENNDISDSMDGLDAESISVSDLENPFYSSMERLYYKALTDRTWQKAGIQRGFSKSGLRPLLYTLATNHQIAPGSLTAGMSINENGVPALDGGLPTEDYVSTTSSGLLQLDNSVDAANIQFFTPHLTRLGWMDTRNAVTAAGSGTAVEQSTAALDQAFEGSLVSQINYTELPKMFMLAILLPPAYKTEMYFRAIITHYFKFKDFRGVSFMPEQTGVPSYFNANADLFNPSTYPDVDVSGGDVSKDAIVVGSGTIGYAAYVDGILVTDRSTTGYQKLSIGGTTLVNQTDGVGNEIKYYISDANRTYVPLISVSGRNLYLRMAYQSNGSSSNLTVVSLTAATTNTNYIAAMTAIWGSDYQTKLQQIFGAGSSIVADSVTVIS